jgi:hypothetical protein
MVKLFQYISNWWKARHMFVWLDPNDNSVTLSRRLFHSLQREAVERDLGEGDAKVYVFRVRHEDTYTFGFMLSPQFDEPTQLCDIQHNTKLNCIGFETLCPTVAKMFYIYGYSYDKVRKLRVEPRQLPDKRTYYHIIPA